MGFFKKVRRRIKGVAKVVRKPLAVFAGGHAMTGLVARVAPKAIGLKSTSSRALVKVTQSTMLKAGAGALAGGGVAKMLAPPPAPVQTGPTQQEGALWFLLFSLLQRGR